MTRDELKAAAVSMLERSYCPYSHFPVGAALECEDGTVYTGCNIENAGYSATVCAERTAVFKAVSEGEREFSAIAVVGGSGDSIDPACTPCGVCRQVLAEFCDPTMPVILGNSDQLKVLTLENLLPLAFTSKNL